MLLAIYLLLEQHEPSLQIVGQSGGVIQRAGVQPESFWLVAPGFVDGPLEEPFAKSLADKFGHQAELDQLNLIRLAAIQLGEASGRGVDVQDVNSSRGSPMMAASASSDIFRRLSQ